jgi:hypothetical protein
MMLSRIHSGVVYAGVLTYQAIKLTDCLEDDSNDEDSCGSSSDDVNNSTPENSSSSNCRRLWGICLLWGTREL